MSDFDELKDLINKYKDENIYLSNLNILVGNNIHEEVVKKLANYGKKVLFCTGNTAMRNLGFVDKYKNLFQKYGLEFTHYDNISANPTLKQMEVGLEVAKKIKPDIIFALGGGSVIDTAKAISVGIYGNIWDFIEKKSEIKSAIPIIASSTTSGTGSQVTPYAVITNTDTLEKKTLKHNLILPKLSVCDVDITRHTPRYIIATTGFDVLCHAVEVYTRLDCSKGAKEFAEKSLTLLSKHLIKSYNNGKIEDKLGMIFADLYAGIALALIGTHVPHAISHPISARFPLINHGQSLAYVMKITSEKQIEKGDNILKEVFKKASRLLGGNENFIETIDNYISELNLNKEIQKFEDEDIKLITEDTLGYRKKSIERCPSKLSEEEIKQIIVDSLKSK